MTASLKCAVRGVSVWGGGASNLSDLVRIAEGQTPMELASNPKPERIPPRERRRAPLSVRLAVEVADNACAEAKVDPASTTSVFASGMGDMDLTDYMCKTLAVPPRLLSPTKFHNSVHNAAAGYWTISTGCHQAASAICAFEHTFPTALLEAVVQCVDEQQPVLLVVSDIASPAVFEDLKPVKSAFACAMVLSPELTHEAKTLSCQLSPMASANDQSWPTLASKVASKVASEALQELYLSNPAARALPMLLDSTGDGSWDYPLGRGRRLTVEMGS